LRIEAHIHGQGVLQASHHQHRAYQQDNRQGDLPAHRQIAQLPMPKPPGPSLILERWDRIRTARLKGRRQSEQQDG
jgi:hypothetical protein